MRHFFKPHKDCSWDQRMEMQKRSMERNGEEGRNRLATGGRVNRGVWERPEHTPDKLRIMTNANNERPHLKSMMISGGRRSRTWRCCQGEKSQQSCPGSLLWKLLRLLYPCFPIFFLAPLLYRKYVYERAKEKEKQLNQRFFKSYLGRSLRLG